VLLQVIEADIIAAYYYQAGSIESGLQYDRQVKEAQKLLKSRDEYKKILAPKKPKETASIIKIDKKRVENISLNGKKLEIFSAIA
jgi:carboxyl-terminal processing protease